jgi:hypothetical protein
MQHVENLHLGPTFCLFTEENYCEVCACPASASFLILGVVLASVRHNESISLFSFFKQTFF